MANQKTFAQLVSGQIAAVQARAAGLLDFTIGSIMRSFVESVSGVALWLQGMILRTLARSRASTSSGADLDSWMADFGLVRLPADSALGEVTFQRFTAIAAVTIPIGAAVETGDGTQAFLITLDADHPAIDGALDAYVMGVGVTSLTVPAAALVPGSAGNVAPGAINTITTPLPGVDKVVNEAAFTAGTDAESDEGFRERFRLYLESLSRGTPNAIRYAVQSVGIGIDMALVEGANYADTPTAGYFYLVVDDGTGEPDADLLIAVETAVDRVRPVGTNFGVFAPVKIDGNVELAVLVSDGAPATVAQAVEDAITAYINSLKIGEDLVYTRLYQVAYNASAGVQFVQPGLTINGATADLAASLKQVIRAGTINATVL